MSRDRITRTEQIIIDSQHKLSGTNNDYIIDLKGINTNGNTYSSAFLNRFDYVVGIRVLGATIKESLETTTNVENITAVDFVCPQIPLSAQQLSGPLGYVWFRLPLVLNYRGSNSRNLYSDYFDFPESKTYYFEPTKLDRLSISLYQNSKPPVLYDTTNDSTHRNFFIVEITYLDRDKKDDIN